MAVATVAPRISPLQRGVITAEAISNYASLAAQIKSLETQQDRLRDVLRYGPVKIECTHERVACKDCGATLSPGRRPT
jgi:hypothetical protein